MFSEDHNQMEEHLDLMSCDGSADHHESEGSAGNPDKRRKGSAREPKTHEEKLADKAQKALVKTTISGPSILKDICKKVGAAGQIRVELQTLPYVTDLLKALDAATVELSSCHTELQKTLGGDPKQIDEEVLRSGHDAAKAASLKFHLVYDEALARAKKVKPAGSKA